MREVLNWVPGCLLQFCAFTIRITFSRLFDLPGVKRRNNQGLYVKRSAYSSLCCSIANMWKALLVFFLKKKSLVI